MKYLDGFREEGAARALVARIERTATSLARAGRRVSLMEVCGSHTMAISRYGIRNLLPESIRLLSGPGCPVCVTAPGYVDAAIQLADQGHTLVTFGDMMRVPGSHQTLSQARSRGGDVRVCLSPKEAVELARSEPRRQVVFLAIGFETTLAPLCTLVRDAERGGLDNLTLLTAFKLVPPALSALLADPEVRVDGFLCPAHVSAIIGADAYLPFVAGWHVPCVVCGFEPLDILLAIDGATRQLSEGTARLDNQYDRVVRPQGNVAAQSLIDQYFEDADAWWRGIGVIPTSGKRLRPEYAKYDAALRFGVDTNGGKTAKKCCCGDVLKGKIVPSECSLFGKACRPENPIGPCMVSSEGSCAAHHRYQGQAR